MITTKDQLEILNARCELAVRYATRNSFRNEIDCEKIHDRAVFQLENLSSVATSLVQRHPELV